MITLGLSRVRYSYYCAKEHWLLLALAGLVAWAICWATGKGAL
jgi:hypothetical protein